MAGRRTLHTTLVAALSADTVAGLAPFGGDTYLPPPRAYATTYALWFLLGLAAGVSAGAERLAGQLSVLVLLAKLVLGPAGPKFVSALDRIAVTFPATSTTATTAQPSTATA